MGENCDKHDLVWDHRMPLIVKEISQRNADIVCLQVNHEGVGDKGTEKMNKMSSQLEDKLLMTLFQEIDKFSELMPRLANFGYDGIHEWKGKDGSAVLWKKDK